MSLVNESLKLSSLIIKYGRYANTFAEQMWVAIVNTRTVNIFFTNELVKLTMHWTTGPWLWLWNRFKRAGYTWQIFKHFAQGRKLLWHPVFFPANQGPADKRSTLKQKNTNKGSKFFSFQKEGEVINRVASPESVCIPFKLVILDRNSTLNINPLFCWTRIDPAFANCRSRSVGFWRSQLIWICTVCHQVHEFMSTIWIKRSDWLTIRSGCGISIYSAGQELMQLQMSQATKLHVRPAKTEINLRIRVVNLISVSAWHSVRSKASSGGQRRHWSAWVFPWCTCQFVGFVMCWLKFILFSSSV